MSASEQGHEERLLDYAYGELSASEAKQVEAHLEGCQRCSSELAELEGVRGQVAKLEPVAPPEAGLDSILAYGRQAAARHATEPTRHPEPSGGWRRWIAPLSGLMALCLVVVVAQRAEDGVPSVDEVLAEARRDTKLDRASGAPPSRDPLSVAEAPTSTPSRDVAGSTRYGSEATERDVRVERHDARQRAKLERRRNDVAREQEEAAFAQELGGAAAPPASLPSAGKPQRRATAKPQAQKRKESVTNDAAAAPAEVSEIALDAAVGSRAGRAATAAPAAAPPAPTTSAPATAASRAPSKKRAGPIGAPAEALPSREEPFALEESEALDDAGVRSDAPELSTRGRASMAADVPRHAASGRTEPDEPATGPGPRALLDRATRARVSGHWEEEIRLLERALAAGASGNLERLVLLRLCEARAILGPPSARDAACRAVSDRFPGTPEAERARAVLGE